MFRVPSCQPQRTRRAVGEAGEQHDVALLQLLRNGVALQEPHAARRLHAAAAVAQTQAVKSGQCSQGTCC